MGRERPTTTIGTALVMELARIFGMPDVVTERTIWLRALERDGPERRALSAGTAGQGGSADRAVPRSRSGSG
jgi:hypothetical protein